MHFVQKEVTPTLLDKHICQLNQPVLRKPYIVKTHIEGRTVTLKISFHVLEQNGCFADATSTPDPYHTGIPVYFFGITPGKIH